jgi:hypothetical protein
MASVVRTSIRQSRFFSKPRVCLSVLCGLLLSAACLFAQTAGASDCLPDEGVFFSCRLEGNHRTVSLCTAPQATPFQAITYRYGSETKNELTYVASLEDHNRFLGTISPVGPNASVRQVWFAIKNIKYIVTACVGGDCPHRGGLIVFRGSQLLMSRACENDSNGHAWFSSEVVKFGSDFDSSRSKTQLIDLQDYDNNVNVLYPWKPVN